MEYSREEDEECRGCLGELGEDESHVGYCSWECLARALEDELEEVRSKNQRALESVQDALGKLTTRLSSARLRCGALRRILEEVAPERLEAFEREVGE